MRWLDLDRRQFFGRVFEIGTAAAWLRSLEVRSSSPASPPDLLGQHGSPLRLTVRDGDAVLREGWRLLQAGLAHDPVNVTTIQRGPCGIGTPVDVGGGLFTDRLMVMMDSATFPALPVTINAFVEQIRFYGLDRFGELPLPSGVLYGGRCGALRLIAEYDILRDDLLLRFDLIGRRNPQWAERERIKALKAHLRRGSRRLDPNRLPA